ncbi:late competence development ComFB family protein [Treponema sp.]|uniref:late competence development ComFB family protein n=1 Tax=Treponema sp. TaxID=166 RepID=UPI003FD79A18
MENIHNLMEETVLSHVNDLYDQAKARNAAWLTCDCKNCRLDTASYVLNRIPPRYVVSGRGVTHSNAFLNGNSQVSADIDKLVIEGMKIVNSAKRPYHREQRINMAPSVKPETFAFHFPVFEGNILDGQTFEPLAGTQVKLNLNGSAVKMMDITWPNPCSTYGTTKGTYTFWAVPVEAESEGLVKKFNFSIHVESDGYCPADCIFTVPVTSETNEKRDLDSTYSVKIKDIFLFRKGTEDENEDNF